MNFWKKRNREEVVLEHTDCIVNLFLQRNEHEFTELELVQMLNDVKRIVKSQLELRVLDCKSKSNDLSQKSSEIESAITLIE